MQFANFLAKSYASCVFFCGKLWFSCGKCCFLPLRWIQANITTPSAQDSNSEKTATCPHTGTSHLIRIKFSELWIKQHNSIVEIEMQFPQDFKLSGNSDCPYSDSAGRHLCVLNLGFRVVHQPYSSWFCYGAKDAFRKASHLQNVNA